MKEFEEPTFLLLVLYAVAAISGGLGGCAAASVYFTHAQKSRLPFVVAYFMLGVCFGIITLACMLVYDWTLSNINEIVMYAGTAGAAGATALASANFSAKAYLRRLGLEVQVTVRSPDEERRNEDE